MPIVLIIKETDDSHSVVLTTRPLILGRSSACDVRIRDEKVSGRHLALKLSDKGRVMLKDLESTNGTYLNGAQVAEGHLMLSDQLTIGDVLIKLDNKQMSPKEKRLLTRDDAPTQIKYIKLPGTSNTSSGELGKKQASNNPGEEERPTVIFNPDSSNSTRAPNIKKEEEVDETPSTEPEKQTESSVFSYKEEGEETQSRSSNEKPGVLTKDKNQMEMEKSTGDTKFLKTEAPDKTESKKHKDRKKHSNKKHVESKKQKTSFFKDIVSIFKKN